MISVSVFSVPLSKAQPRTVIVSPVSTAQTINKTGHNNNNNVTWFPWARSLTRRRKLRVYFFRRGESGGRNLIRNFSSVTTHCGYKNEWLRFTVWSDKPYATRTMTIMSNRGKNVEWRLIIDHDGKKNETVWGMMRWGGTICMHVDLSGDPLRGQRLPYWPLDHIHLPKFMQSTLSPFPRMQDFS